MDDITEHTTQPTEAVGADEGGSPSVEELDGDLLPSLVGNLLTGSGRSVTADDPLPIRALALSSRDRELLRLVSRMPALDRGDIAGVLGWSLERATTRRNRLIRLGLLRLLEEREVGEAAKLKLVEATLDGLRIVAADEGLTLGQMVRYCGLVGGGPERPIGTRNALIGRLEHTREVASVLADICRSARMLAERGEYDDVIEWRNAAESACGHARPDLYVLYRHRGQLSGAFVELDRGTMRARDYRKKLLAYAEVIRSERYARDYDGFPMILFLTPDPQAEERVARVAREVVHDRRVRLPILLTHLWRAGSQPEGTNGLLGPIWREADGGPGRRLWLLPVAGPDGSPSEDHAPRPERQPRSRRTGTSDTISPGIEEETP